MKRILFSIFILMLLFLVSFSSLSANEIKEVGSTSDADGITNRHALIIGTDPWAYCTNDAEDMSTLLENNNWNVNVLKGSDATKENIFNGIDWLAEQSDNDDIVLFYFSGHGAKRVIADYYDFPIFLIQLKLQFLKISPLTIQVLVFDTCHAGSMDIGAEVPNFKLKFYDYQGDYPKDDDEFEESGFFGFDGAGRVVLASCRSFQFSYGDPYFENGVFTYYFINGLNNKENDNNNNGWISEQEAFDYAKPLTRQRAIEYALLGQWPKKVKDTNLGQVDLIKKGEGVSRDRIFSNLENINLINQKIRLLWSLLRL